MTVRAPSLPRLSGVVRAGAALAGGHVATEGAVVLAYHDVGDDPSNRTDHYVSPAQLRRQLTTAVDMGVRFVDLVTLTEAFLSGQPVDGLAAVVFDDGLVGVHRHALPVLADLGLTATVFAVTSGLGSSPPWWRGAARLMTRGELAEVAGAGFAVASHTRTHPSLPGLDATGLADELVGARHELQDLVQTPVDLLAYPFGHHDARVREAVAAAGYAAGFSFLNGRITAGLDRFRLPRITMWAGQGRARLAYHLARSSRSWPDTQSDVVGGPGAE